MGHVEQLFVGTRAHKSMINMRLVWPIQPVLVIVWMVMCYWWRINRSKVKFIRSTIIILVIGTWSWNLFALISFGIISVKSDSPALNSQKLVWNKGSGSYLQKNFVCFIKSSSKQKNCFDDASTWPKAGTGEIPRQDQQQTFQTKYHSWHQAKSWSPKQHSSPKYPPLPMAQNSPHSRRTNNPRQTSIS